MRRREFPFQKGGEDAEGGGEEGQKLTFTNVSYATKKEERRDFFSRRSRKIFH